MSDTTTTTIKPAATKRMRNGSVVLTNRHCEKRVSARIKIYDRKCPGLFAVLTVAGITSLSFKFTNPSTGKHRTGWLGIYNPETFTVEDARSKVYGLRGTGAAALAETFRNRKLQQAKRGKTVDDIIAERIAWMKTPVRKPDEEMRPRIETWSNVASHLRRFISPRLGRKLATEVTKNDIATLSNDIVAGRHGGKPSISNARHMRRAATGLFNWAAEAGREYVTASPCANLPKLDAEHPRTRVLSANEIRTFWHGLDREDLPWDRRTRLVLKFEQPLSDLAVEIIREALESEDQQFVFESPVYEGQPLYRTAMGVALRGTTYTDGKRKGQTKTPGICALLGLKPFTPHDLRRTAATLAGELGHSEAAIAKCLDHAVTKDNGEKINRVTGIYNQSKRTQQKRAVLDGIAAELRRIVGRPVKHQNARLAA